MSPCEIRLPEVAVTVLVRLNAASPSRALRLLSFGKHQLAADPGVRFFKCLGSGAGGGFTLMPSLHHLGLFATFDTDSDARAFIGSEVLRRLVLDHADEQFVCRMRAISIRGTWDGRAPCRVQPSEVDYRGPIAAITRASIRPWRAAAFWRYAAPAQDQLRHVQGCCVAAGLGEAPLLRQATFTIWRSAADMTAFSRTAEHGTAARAAMRQGYFSEDMFARFVPIACEGSWQGRTFHGLADIS